MPDTLDYAWRCHLPSYVTTPSVRLLSILPVFPEVNAKKEFYPLLPNIAGRL